MAVKSGVSFDTILEDGKDVPTSQAHKVKLQKDWHQIKTLFSEGSDVRSDSDSAVLGQLNFV